MIRVQGLDKEFDSWVKNDRSFRYVVNHPKLKRNSHVPERYLGEEGGSTRTQKEFRAFASWVRLWQKRIKDKWLAEHKDIAQSEEANVRATIAAHPTMDKASRLKLIKKLATTKPLRVKLETLLVFKLPKQRVKKKRLDPKKPQVFHKVGGAEVIVEPRVQQHALA
jgi:hypothetical protein